MMSVFSSVMYLKRLELQGFKTFAQKTVLEFVPDSAGRRGITAVVGPNGSGKSNIADALRWVMGEQSLKLLRGKKSEDVIFSGSNRRARSGFAEVSLILENDPPSHEASHSAKATSDRSGGGLVADWSEVCITRRLYRDGQSDYEVNRQAARLQDVVLLLAQCGIGQRTYSVIGQGMVDAVLSASPSERKEFFDEAFGLRPFQLKRQSAINKMEEARKNLTQADIQLREIGPRLVTLERQVKRLQQRESIETELKALEKSYYGAGWREISESVLSIQTKLTRAKNEQSAIEAEAKRLETELGSMEKAVPASEGFRELRQALDQLAGKRAELRERQVKLEARREIAEARSEKPWAALPLSKIIESIDTIKSKHEELDRILGEEKPDLKRVRQLAKELRGTSQELLSKLQRPAPEPTQRETPPLAPPQGGGEKTPPSPSSWRREFAEIAAALADVAEKTADAEAKLETWNKNEEGKRTHIFEVQHRLNAKREEARSAERGTSELSVELARIETRREGFLAELRQNAPALEASLNELAAADPSGLDSRLPTTLGLRGTGRGNDGIDSAARLQRLRSQLEWIGGIDPESIKEHGETKTRFEFLSTQVEDLRGGITALETVIKELDTTIKERSATAFKTLDREFGIYFKKLFNGGEGNLIEIEEEPEVDEQGNIIKEPEEGAIAGVEIQAMPPGKRLKSIALLSGGERALTSIALICAIMATNPSPFVVLDEVDAALDEANSRKFAEIINSLADKTQFIVVTHNRATMAESTVLYGVTMGDDGMSQLLSVKLEEVEKMTRKE